MWCRGPLDQWCKEGNNSWERMSELAMMADMRAGSCCWKRKSAISILQILTHRQYSYIISSWLILKKDSYTGKKVSRSWRSACSQRSKRGSVMSQGYLVQPRVSNTFWGAPESNRRGISSNSVTVWWMGRLTYKGRAMFDQRLRVLFLGVLVAM